MSLKFLTAKALATGAALAISAGGAAVAANVVLPATAPVVFGAVAAPGNASLVDLSASGESTPSTPVVDVVIPDAGAPSPEVVEPSQGKASNLGETPEADHAVVEPPSTTIPPIVTPTTRAPYVESSHQGQGGGEHHYEEEGGDD